MTAQTSAGRTAVEHQLGPLADIPVGEGRCYAVDGVQVAVFRLRNGEVHATQAACPHRGGPLADGQLDDRVVVCPLHAYAYVLQTGRRVGDDDEPSGGLAPGVAASSGEPEAHATPSLALRVYRVRVTLDGTVLVTLPPERGGRAVPCSPA